jgi:hypothetical protein
MAKCHSGVEQSTESKRSIKDKLTQKEMPVTQRHFKTWEVEFKHYRHMKGCPRIR